MDSLQAWIALIWFPGWTIAFAVAWVVAEIQDRRWRRDHPGAARMLDAVRHGDCNTIPWSRPTAPETDQMMDKETR